MRSKMSAIGTSDSAFHDGNPSTGVLGTIVTADWLNTVQASTMDLQDELLNVLAAASIANDPTVKTQILAAINKLSKLNMQSGAATFATDTGVANAYVVSLTPALASPRGEGMVIRFKVANANTGACTVNDGVSTVPIVGLALSALQGGEMAAGGDAWIQWHPSVGTGSYVLLFCSGAPMQVAQGNKSGHAITKAQLDAATGSSVYVSVTAVNNTLVFTLPSGTVLTFRNPTLSNGAPVKITTSADLTYTIPQGATQGTLSGILANLIPAVFYNGGSPVLGAVNAAGATDLSDGQLFSATAVSTSATSASVIYASSAVSNSPAIFLPPVQITEAVAGTWATAPTLVQPAANQNTAMFEKRMALPAVATSSGLSIGFQIPSWAKKITVQLVGVSTSATSALLIKLGVGGVAQSAAYNSSGFFNSNTTVTATTGFFAGYRQNAAGTIDGAITLTKHSDLSWTAQGYTHNANLSNSGSVGGSCTLTGVADSIFLTTTNGTDTFDAGSVSILIEG